ncbi:MAG: sigma-E factor negative regulatory protein [Gammaproteobacteria bacterium]|nr:sigma-E factor negative regulatory protein [Gammaproteobacteria bacterium]
MQISAFVDGELPENETELLLRRLSQDAELREQVAHYLSIGRLIRQERVLPNMNGLRSRILAELGEEPTVSVPAQVKNESRLVRPAVGFAVAASVALLAIVGLRQATPPGEVPAESPVAAYTEPAIDDELLEMHRRHARTASDHGSSDMLGRFVAFELREGELVEVVPDEPRADDEDDEANETAGAEAATTAQEQ